MRCKHCRRLFSRHLDDRLSQEERGTLDAHLSGCAACRAELVRWQVPSRALRAMGASQALVPDGATERMWRGVVQAMSAGRATPSFEERFVWAARRAAFVGALAAVLIWCGLLFGGGSSEASAGELTQPSATELAASLWAAEPTAEAGIHVE
jgi:anti-sigma factor RsiW